MNLICPHCRAPHDAHTLLGGESGNPTEGSISVCIDCGEFSLFDARGSLRLPTPDEKREFDGDAHLQRIHAAWRRMTHKKTH